MSFFPFKPKNPAEAMIEDQLIQLAIQHFQLKKQLLEVERYKFTSQNQIRQSAQQLSSDTNKQFHKIIENDIKCAEETNRQLILDEEEFESRDRKYKQICDALTQLQQGDPQPIIAIYEDLGFKQLRMDLEEDLGINLQSLIFSAAKSGNPRWKELMEAKLAREETQASEMKIARDLSNNPTAASMASSTTTSISDEPSSSFSSFSLSLPLSDRALGLVAYKNDIQQKIEGYTNHLSVPAVNGTIDATVAAAETQAYRKIETEYETTLKMLMESTSLLADIKNTETLINLAQTIISQFFNDYEYQEDLKGGLQIAAMVASIALFVKTRTNQSDFVLVKQKQIHEEINTQLQARKISKEKAEQMLQNNSYNTVRNLMVRAAISAALARIISQQSVIQKSVTESIRQAQEFLKEDWEEFSLLQKLDAATADRRPDLFRDLFSAGDNFGYSVLPYDNASNPTYGGGLNRLKWKDMALAYLTLCESNRYPLGDERILKDAKEKARAEDFVKRMAFLEPMQDIKEKMGLIAFELHSTGKLQDILQVSNPKSNSIPGENISSERAKQLHDNFNEIFNDAYKKISEKSYIQNSTYPIYLKLSETAEKLITQICPVRHLNCNINEFKNMDIYKVAYAFVKKHLIKEITEITKNKETRETRELVSARLSNDAIDVLESKNYAESEKLIEAAIFAGFVRKGIMDHPEGFSEPQSTDYIFKPGYYIQYNRGYGYHSSFRNKEHLCVFKATSSHIPYFHLFSTFYFGDEFRGEVDEIIKVSSKSPKERREYINTIQTTNTYLFQQIDLLEAYHSALDNLDQLRNKEIPMVFDENLSIEVATRYRSYQKGKNASNNNTTNSLILLQKRLESIIYQMAMDRRFDEVASTTSSATNSATNSAMNPSTNKYSVEEYYVNNSLHSDLNLNINLNSKSLQQTDSLILAMTGHTYWGPALIKALTLATITEGFTERDTNKVKALVYAGLMRNYIKRRLKGSLGIINQLSPTTGNEFIEKAMTVTQEKTWMIEVLHDFRNLFRVRNEAFIDESKIRHLLEVSTKSLPALIEYQKTLPSRNPQNKLSAEMINVYSFGSTTSSHSRNLIQSRNHTEQTQPKLFDLSEYYELVAVFRDITYSHKYEPGDPKILREALLIAQNRPTLSPFKEFIPIIQKPWNKISFSFRDPENWLYRFVPKGTRQEEASLIPRSFPVQLNHTYNKMDRELHDTVVQTWPSPIELYVEGAERNPRHLRHLKRRGLPIPPTAIIDRTQAAPSIKSSCKSIMLPTQFRQPQSHRCALNGVSQNNIEICLPTGNYDLECVSHTGSKSFRHSFYIEKGHYLNRQLEQYYSLTSPYKVTFNQILSGSYQLKRHGNNGNLIKTETFQNTTYLNISIPEMQEPGPITLTIIPNQDVRYAISQNIQLAPLAKLKHHFQIEPNWSQLDFNATTTQDGTLFKFGNKQTVKVSNDNKMTLCQPPIINEFKVNQEENEYYLKRKAELKNFLTIRNTHHPLAKAILSAHWLTSKNMMMGPLLFVGLYIEQANFPELNEKYLDLLSQQIALTELTKEWGYEKTLAFIESQPKEFSSITPLIYKQLFHPNSNTVETLILWVMTCFLKVLEDTEVRLDPNEILRITREILSFRDQSTFDAYQEELFDEYCEDLNDNFEDNNNAINSEFYTWLTDIHNRFGADNERNQSIKEKIETLRREAEYDHGLRACETSNQQGRNHKDNLAISALLLEHLIQTARQHEAELQAIERQCQAQAAEIEKELQDNREASARLQAQLQDVQEQIKNQKKHQKRQRNRGLIKACIGMALGAFFAPMLLQAMATQLFNMGYTLYAATSAGLQGALSSGISAIVTGKNIAQEALLGGLTSVAGSFASNGLKSLNASRDVAPTLFRMAATSVAKTSTQCLLTHERLGKNLVSNLACDLILGQPESNSDSASEINSQITSQKNSLINSQMKQQLNSQTKVASQLTKTLIETKQLLTKSVVSAGVNSLVHKQPFTSALTCALASNIGQLAGSTLAQNTIEEQNRKALEKAIAEQQQAEFKLRAEQAKTTEQTIQLAQTKQPKVTNTFTPVDSESTKHQKDHPISTKSPSLYNNEFTSYQDLSQKPQGKLQTQQEARVTGLLSTDEFMIGVDKYSTAPSTNNKILTKPKSFSNLMPLPQEMIFNRISQVVDTRSNNIKLLQELSPQTIISKTQFNENESLGPRISKLDSNAPSNEIGFWREIYRRGSGRILNLWDNGMEYLRNNPRVAMLAATTIQVSSIVSDSLVSIAGNKIAGPDFQQKQEKIHMAMGNTIKDLEKRWAITREDKAAVMVPLLLMGVKSGFQITKREYGGKKEVIASFQIEKSRNSVAHDINAQIALNKKMSALEGAQRDAFKIEHLHDGRIRYFDVERPSRKPGPTRGSSFVTEYNPKTGQVRQWNESYNHYGDVNRVHPKTLDGHDLRAQHYPPIEKELESYNKRLGEKK